MAAGERREDGDCNPEARGQIRYRQARLHRAAAALAGEAHDAAHRLENRVVALLILVWPALPEARARDVDEPRVECRERGKVERVFAERADREILHQHVGLLRELADELAALLRAQVDGDRFLGAVAHEVVGAVARELRLESARLVAGAGLLDLDNARAELGEDHGREWAREHARQIEDRQALERLHVPSSSVPKLRMRLFASRPRSSARSSGRSATSWKSCLVCAIAGRLTAASCAASASAAFMRLARGTTRFTMPSAAARFASIGSPRATSSKAALRPTWRTRFAITMAATMPCFVSG